MSYRVVYGETIPAWERIFPTMREAKAFAAKHRGFGDVIFSVKEVVPGEWPQSLMAKLDSARPAPEQTTPAQPGGSGGPEA